ncbi:MAG: GWxTD domain-containing protein, partial [Gemmatimonadota bacterium]
MIRFRLYALSAAALLLPVAMPGHAIKEEVKLLAVRFYDAGSGLTQVRAFIQVPLDVLTPTGNDANAVVSYQVGIHLLDSAGAMLSEDAWPAQRVSANLREPGVTSVKSLEFVLRPGQYRLEVTVRDSVSGTILTARSDLTAYDQPPSASDLVLAPGMRAMTTSDTVVQGTEWRNGSLLVTSAAELVLTPLRSKAFYLLEAYSAAADSGTMTVRIRDSTGQVVVQSPAIPVRVAAGGGVLRGQLDLEGLPAGDYDLDVVVQLGGQQIDRTGTFTMMPSGPVLARHAAEVAQLLTTDAGYFGAMDEPALDAAFEPLSYIASSRDLRMFRGATLATKRRFLTDFWEKRDIDSAGRNERREQFYGMLSYADSAFRERGSNTQSGWKTDRGRIYVQRGAPDEVLDKLREGRAPTYLVWRYTRGRPEWFIFADRSGLGAYKLMHSNNRMEPGAPDWTDILGP